nr:hypothetical protein [Tanacetum cinerariifolium]
MADVNAPSGQTPAMAPPVCADDQILPHIRWVPIGKRNCYLDLEKSQSNPIYKIAMDLLKNTNFFRAFTASSNLPSIYIQQFWDTILYDKKAGCYKCQLDEQWFNLTKETLREALQITPVNRNQAFAAPPSIDRLIDFVNQLGYPNVSRKTRQPRRSPKSVSASEAEEVPVEEPQVADEDADYQKAVEESMKDAYALPKGPFPPVVIREPESGKYQPLPDVPGKGKAKVTEEQVAHALLCLQKHKKTNSEEESEKIVLGVEKGCQDEGQAGPDLDAQAKDQTGSDVGAQAEGQAGSNPDETSEGQAGPDPGNAEARVQSTSSPVFYIGSDREHIDLDVANVSPQPSTEQLDEWFTATVYLNVQENLKLAIEEPVFLEEPASSSRTLSSLQHLSRDFRSGDQFFSDKHSNADKNAKTEVESMVNVMIQQALSSISLMTSPIIDLTSRPESPKEYQQLKATTTDTTTTTTTLPPPQAPQQSTTKAMMVKRIGELERILADLIQVNKTMKERLDKHGARLYTLEQLDIPQQVSIAVSEVVTDAVDWAMQALLRNRFRDLPEADMKEILHQRMWESDSYKSHEDLLSVTESPYLVVGDDQRT